MNRTVLSVGVLFVGISQFAASCTTKTGPGPAPTDTTSAPPPPVPSGTGAPTVIPTPPTPSAVVGDPGACSAACNGAQTLCSNPKPFAHCLSQCQAVAAQVAAPNADCLALTYTCGKKCP